MLVVLDSSAKPGISGVAVLKTETPFGAIQYQEVDINESVIVIIHQQPGTNPKSLAYAARTLGGTRVLSLIRDSHTRLATTPADFIEFTSGRPTTFFETIGTGSVQQNPVATESMATAVARQLSRPSTALTGEAEQALWAEQVRLPWAGQGTVVRFSWMPARLPAVLALVARLRQHGCSPLLTGRASGAGTLRLYGDDTACAAAISDLRASADVGHVVLLRGSPELKTRIDVWGPPTGSAAVARSLKRMFDPAGVLNAGRGPI
jgi:hypothetical protein